VAEVEVGRLADQKGKSSKVRQLGQPMVEDHSKGTANSKRSPLRPILRCRRRRTLKTGDARAPRKAQGDAFDANYIQAKSRLIMIRRHSSNRRSDRDRIPGLKNFASQSLPMIMQHLEMAQNINRLTGTAER
jgi:putative membrane protein